MRGSKTESSSTLRVSSALPRRRALEGAAAAAKEGRDGDGCDHVPLKGGTEREWDAVMLERMTAAKKQPG